MGISDEARKAWSDIFRDLLDEHNMIFYGLLTLAIIEPELREIVVAGILGYWTKSKTT